MPTGTFHFLNVKNGDCSIIEHISGHVSMIDTCNARKPENEEEFSLSEFLVLSKSAEFLAEATRAAKNYNQKVDPENPVEYLKKFGIGSIFRFVLTHPDMDHMDGIKDIFEEFAPINFYDTDNNKVMNNWEGSPYREEDWTFYKKLRDEKPDSDPKRLVVFAGDNGIHRTKNWEGKPPGDAFYVLSPTRALVDAGNECGDHNDCCYVILYWSASGKILLSGDSHDSTWKHLLENHADAISDVDLLIAPHHGRDSDRDYSFLGVVKPKLTFFGNAISKHLAYDAWRNRGLPFITNNMAGNMIVQCNGGPMKLFVSNESFARDENEETWYSATYKGWYVKDIV